MNESRTHAIAKIHGGPSNPTLHGTVCFQQLRTGVLVTAEVFNLPQTRPSGAGIFALHIHAGTRCSGTAENPFADAKGHYNPDANPHPYHAGDLPPLFGNHGYAYLSVFTDRFSVEEILGRVVIVHQNPDDFTTQPSGNAGAMIACGKIYAGACRPNQWAICHDAPML